MCAELRFFTLRQLQLAFVVMCLATRVVAQVSLDELSRATYRSITALVEPATGVPHDTLNRVILDLYPQFASVRNLAPTIAPPNGMKVLVCTDAACRHDGSVGLQIDYSVPEPGSFQAFFPFDFTGRPPLDVTQATQLEFWARGKEGNESFEIVLWSPCGVFPTIPTPKFEVTSQWQRFRIRLRDYASEAKLRSLCSVSIATSRAIADRHPVGTFYVDNIAFINDAGERVPIANDEETSVTNIGLHLAAVVAARELGIESEASALSKASKAIDSIERLQKWHGFPQTHNTAVSLAPVNDDTCISTVDTGYFAAGLIVVRNTMPQLAARAGALLDAMEWDYLFDSNFGLPFGCRYPDGRSSEFHYDFFAADSHTAHAIGIASGRMPATSWNKLNRQIENGRCDPEAHFAPGWTGGGLFMQLLPAILLEYQRSALGASSRAFVRDQVCYGSTLFASGRSKANVWGWSATLPPEGAVTPTGPVSADGCPPNDPNHRGCYCGYGCTRTDFVVPHAALLAAEVVTPEILQKDLVALHAIGGRPAVNDGLTTTDFGFVSSVSIVDDTVSPVYLVLDQEMAFLAIANRVTGGRIRGFVCIDPMMSRLRQLIPGDYRFACARTRAVKPAR
jgi:hypothetical protein